MSKYRVEIETPANTQGAEKTAKALQDVGKSATAAATATTQAGDAAKGAAGAMGGLTSSLLASASPWKAVILLMAVAITKLRQFQADIDEMASSVQKLDPANNSLKTFFELIAKNRSSDDDFAKRLAAIGTAAETSESKIQRMTQVMNKTLSLEAGEDDARKKLRLAQIDQDEKTGKISKAGAVEARARVDVAFARREADRENRRRAGEVQAAFNLRTGAEDARIAAEKALPGAREERLAAQKSLGDEQLRAKNLADAGIQFGNENLTREKAIERRDKLKTSGDSWLSMLSLQIANPNVNLPFTEEGRAQYLSDLNSAIEGFDRNKDSQAALVARAQGRLTRATRNVGDLESAATQSEQVRVNADRKYRNSIADAGQEQGSSARTQRMEAVAGGIEAETARLVEAMERIHAALKLVNAANLRELQR